MGGKIVVAGVASLTVNMGVAEFPVSYTSVQSPGWLETGVGGAGQHVASILRGLGDDVTLCTVVGRDPAGSLVRDNLRATGLDGPSVVDGPGSTYSVVLVDPDGRRMVWPHLTLVNTVEYPEGRFVEAARDADLAVLSAVDFVRGLLPSAVLRGVPVAVDLNVIADVNEQHYRPWLDVADIVFCSHERLPCSPSEWIARIFARSPGCLIAAVGCGKDGCQLGLRDGRLVSAKPVTPLGVRNTSTAGDSLFAAFLHSWVATGNPVEALADAVVFAGWRIGHRFPHPVMLTESDLAELRVRHPVGVSVSRWD
ncbi:carbohydrate kinase family protein [Amycolatopsis thailandensis]|uniref:Carbohydrate kinase family protein n=1 Tax=Amycolatopsis thailandensis TaxID=589330 RepID=A0A229SJ19_9PSEU|nr:carbohydrate kinase family protein [Amycolatopsis thailandensis]OXM58671.1 carbohydrate kinase family protein [Amycolatopsis thailandensis]